ncbi:hypothetical protein M4I32_01230 [Microbacterium sp. LRZ72]|uniref:hypothetical protein n=1 Tax=Microbacterium sp. LRZ72 TaxID=2942481 RepID=UPI0029B1AFEB|nr:hypothetical protein [Microbacterium sp. LRZ72]MDX2375423.1 hypothetical protein [Microbacterium sp. LRZ72]
MRLALVTVVFALLSGSATAQGTAADCGGGFGWNGSCHATTDGSQVDVGGSTTRPGSSGGGEAGSGDRGSTPNTPGAGGGAAEPDAAPCASDLCRPLYTVVSLPDVTAADLASFVPATPALTGEPHGLGVVGMPTNLVATASAQQLSGPLLDYDVTVRFQPIAFHFDHGDGTAATSVSGGARWQALGLAEYSPTPTSHVYTAPGRYTASARVVYEAHVDFGTGSWRPVDGAVTSAATTYPVRVVEVRSALVADTCLAAPHATGC